MKISGEALICGALGLFCLATTQIPKTRTTETTTLDAGADAGNWYVLQGPVDYPGPDSGSGPWVIDHAWCWEEYDHHIDKCMSATMTPIPDGGLIVDMNPEPGLTVHWNLQ